VGTEGSRDRETYAIYKSDGTSYYSPKEPGDSSIAHPERKELHFVAHTTEPDKGNFPPHTCMDPLELPGCRRNVV